MDKIPPKDDWQYWYKKAEFFIDNQTKDRTTNLMLLASEFRNQFQLGIHEGIRDWNTTPR